jgi:hypothetical protein
MTRLGICLETLARFLGKVGTRAGTAPTTLFWGHCSYTNRLGKVTHGFPAGELHPHMLKSEVLICVKLIISELRETIFGQ